MAPRLSSSPGRAIALETEADPDRSPLVSFATAIAALAGGTGEEGTTALELLDQMPDIDILVVAIGGGGLIAGMALAAKAMKPGLRIVGVQPTGAASMHDSLKRGELVELERVTTRVPTLAARRTEEINFEIVRRNVDDIVLIEDDDMDVASRWLWREMNVAADPSGAATVAALMTGAIVPPQGAKVCALVCGAGAEGTAG